MKGMVLIYVMPFLILILSSIYLIFDISINNKIIFQNINRAKLNYSKLLLEQINKNSFIPISLQNKFIDWDEFYLNPIICPFDTADPSNYFTHKEHISSLTCKDINILSKQISSIVGNLFFDVLDTKKIKAKVIITTGSIEVSHLINYVNLVIIASGNIDIKNIDTFDNLTVITGYKYYNNYVNDSLKLRIEEKFMEKIDLINHNTLNALFLTRKPFIYGIQQN